MGRQLALFLFLLLGSLINTELTIKVRGMPCVLVKKLLIYFMVTFMSVQGLPRIKFIRGWCSKIIVNFFGSYLVHDVLHFCKGLKESICVILLPSGYIRREIHASFGSTVHRLMEIRCEFRSSHRDTHLFLGLHHFLVIQLTSRFQEILSRSDKVWVDARVCVRFNLRKSLPCAPAVRKALVSLLQGPVWIEAVVGARAFKSRRL